jgi:4a-hydroxytetrahydrobiopterin dehydratase
VAGERLSEEDIDRALEGLSWTRDGDQIDKTVTLADFKDAMAFVNQVADLAEARNHHPDMAISWNKVSLRLTTHSAGGLTELDFDLARAIDETGH